MSTTDHTTRNHVAIPMASETKASTKTTEFFAYLAVVAAIVITAFIVGDNGSDGGEGDPFGAEQAMRYITFLTIGYMIARGLAKSGSRESDIARDNS